MSTLSTYNDRWWSYKLDGAHRPLSEALPTLEKIGITDLHEGGGDHALPEPNKLEESGEMFFWYLGTYAPRYMRFGRVTFPIEGEPAHRKSWHSVTEYYFHDAAWAVVHPPYHPRGENEPRYYRLGCEHKDRELSPSQARERGAAHYGMCWHVYECTKCGRLISQDSSD